MIAAALTAAEPLRFEPRHIARKIPGCEASFEYVEMVSGPAEARERINAAILAAVVARPNDDLNLAPEGFADHFISDCKETPVEERHFGKDWFISKSVKVLRTTPPVVSLELSEESYYGGAHPNGGLIHMNFDALTGEPIKLASIVKDGWMPALTATAEVYFRKAREIGPTANLKDAGFWFQDGRFKLNDNFALTENGLRFEYNVYEIAPRSMGDTSIEIPLIEIRALLRPEFVR